MSEAETVEEQPDPEPEEEDDGEDMPDIESDERASIDLDDLDVDPDAVEDKAGAGAEEETDDEEDPDDDGGDESAQQAPQVPDGATWGDQYVEMLALLLGEIAEQTDGEPGKTAEDIEQLARGPPLALDEQVDEWLAQSGMGQDVPPGKALAVGTAGIVLVVILTETDLASDLMDSLTSNLQESDLL
ncbi:hypothetical protein [Haloarcula onubensis]|uniref:Uncharacterized protein n=1 Tax=Haloarcula onubensis TaxID=2950539 RepID=A0ABU2FIN3_9EURY|nr:hypothetical protein [Halomicroarcula sp. S3CR25-11]MDS0280621.1 hypothetical protein [Halomicroarcula sp. S3CR25-11]